MSDRNIIRTDERLPVSDNYHMLHTQIANFNNILAAMIQHEGRSGGTTWMNLDEALSFSEKVADREDTAQDAVEIPLRAHIQPIQIQIETPDKCMYPGALFDISRLELYGSAVMGDTFLQGLREKTPAVVHWFGIGASNYWGQRQMQLISPEGESIIIDPSGLMDIKKGRFQGVLNKLVPDIDKAIDMVVGSYLKKNPNGAIFVHRFGEKFDLTAYHQHIRSPEGYATVEEQVADGEISVPESQKANIAKLVEMEARQGVRGRFTNMFGYEHEGDRRAFYVFAGGECRGFNNLGGMPGLISHAMGNYPGEAILVHSPGSPLDFTFAQKLIGSDLDDPQLYLKRVCPRTRLSQCSEANNKRA